MKIAILPIRFNWQHAVRYRRAHDFNSWLTDSATSASTFPTSLLDIFLRCCIIILSAFNCSLLAVSLVLSFFFSLMPCFKLCVPNNCHRSLYRTPSEFSAISTRPRKMTNRTTNWRKSNISRPSSQSWRNGATIRGDVILLTFSIGAKRGIQKLQTRREKRANSKTEMRA